MEVFQNGLPLSAFGLCWVLCPLIDGVSTQAVIHSTVFIKLVKSFGLCIIVDLDGSPIDIDTLLGDSLKLLFLLRVDGVFFE